MPYAAGKVCRYPGCNEVTKNKRGYCDKHKDEGRPGGRVYNNIWAELRKMYMREHPLCEECGAVAEVLHHIIHLKKGGALLDVDNLMSLCNACHGKKHAKD